MSRRRVVATLAVVGAAGAIFVGIAALRADGGLDEDEYRAKNARLIAELPVFPGARPLSTISDKYVSREATGTSVVCNTTSRTFALPGEVSRSRVTGYYKTHMRGWRVLNESETRFELSFRRDEEFVHLLVFTPRDYVLSVDHRCAP